MPRGLRGRGSTGETAGHGHRTGKLLLPLQMAQLVPDAAHLGFTSHTQVWPAGQAPMDESAPFWTPKRTSMGRVVK